MDPNTILIVQGSADQRKQTCQSLSDKGYETIGVGSGKEALAFLSFGSEEVRLVLTEYQLPDYSGYELKKEIEKIPGIKSMPVVFLDTRVSTLLKIELSYFAAT